MQVPRILRESVVNSEVTPLKRRCGVFVYILITLLVNTLGSLKILEFLGGLPTPPDSAPMYNSLDEYDAYIVRINAELYTEIHLVYQQSLDSQAFECNQTLNHIYSEELRVRDEAEHQSKYYCSELVVRLWDYMTDAGLYNHSTETGECLLYGDMGDAEKYMNWYTSAGACVYKIDDERCLYSLYLQRNPSVVCDSDYADWDDHYDLYTSTRNGISCDSTLSDITAAANEAAADLALGYTGSVISRIDYDEGYYYDASALWKGEPGSSRGNMYLPDILSNSFNEWQSTFQDNIIRMESIHREWASYYKYKDAIPSWLLGVAGIDFGEYHGAPDISVPQIPTYHFDTISKYLSTIDATDKVFADYNPPEVLELNIELDYSQTAPEISYTIPDINLQSSILLGNFIHTLDDIKLLVLKILAFDFLLRVAQFLQDVAVLFIQPRRDMSSKSEKCRKRFMWFLKNSSLVVYSALAGVALYFLSQYEFKEDFIVQELAVECTNQVIVQNLEILADYQAEMVEYRSDCDTVIQAENQKTETLNSEYQTRFIDPLLDYEDLYRSDNIYTTAYLPALDHTITVVNFTLPHAEIMALADPGKLNSITDIESYSISTSLCTDSAALLNVETQVDRQVEEYQVYIVQLLAIGFVSLLATTFLRRGAALILWMETTHGYTFDTEFTSTQLLARRKSKRRLGIIYLLVALLVISTIPFLNNYN